MNRYETLVYLFFTRVLRINEGQRLSRWQLTLRCILQPSVLKYVIGSKHYDPMSDSFTIEGIRVSRFFFRNLKRGPHPSPWFRVLRVDSNGHVLMETKVEPL